MFRHVLLLLDGSIAGEAAVSVATELAGRDDALLTILRVVRGHPHQAGDRTGSPINRQGPELEAETYLNRVARRTRLRPGRVRATVHAGSVPRVVLRLAREEAVDLIIIGQDPSSEWPEREVPAVTEHIVGQAHCPVLLVPAGSLDRRYATAGTPPSPWDPA